MNTQDIAVAETLTVTVDGSPIETLPGKTILQTLLEVGIHVPHLCYDARMGDCHGNCGVCVVEIAGQDKFVQSCQTPVKDGMEIVTKNSALDAYRRVRFDQLLADHNADCVAPCERTCPAEIDIQAYLRQAANGNYDAALRIIKEKNPFPLTCGRVCPHPCESECRRSLVDSPVSINAVKRFVADVDLSKKHPYQPRKKPATGKKIAIVGAGPSGLSAAYYSAINGHQVTVYDQQPEPGGMLRYGIPDYRLPQSVLDQETNLIFDLGVSFIPNRRLGTQLRLEDLQQANDAVYIAVGSWQASSMRVEGEMTQGVWQGIRYLEEVAKGRQIALGDKVVVVGGGNTAIDCARTALRQGANEVKLLYRRMREQMPAEPHEVEDAIQEGIQMEFLAMPTRIESNAAGQVAQMHCMRMELGEPDKGGRRRPVPVEGSEYAFEATAVIAAIGQSTDTSYLWDDAQPTLNRWGDVEINGKTMQTSLENVFAGGDCVTGPATVVQAVGAGRRAAEAMDEYMNTGQVSEKGEDYACNRGSLEDLSRHEFEILPKQDRATMPRIDRDTCVGTFNEVETGLTEDQAVSEAERCLKCGCAQRGNCTLRNEAASHGIQHQPPLRELQYRPVVKDHPFIVRDHNKCISCGRCVAACNEVAGPDVLTFYLKDGKLCIGTKSGNALEETDCVSCGQCVNACPCGALEYKREGDRVFKALNNPKKTVIGFVAPAVRSVIMSHYNLDYHEAAPFMAGLLKKMGFDQVFDFTFAADLTILEETNEFLGRLESGTRLPQFTSCCPGWVNFLERRYPELLPHLSSCKSPQQMMGATVKNHFPEWAGLNQEKDDIFVVSVVPCMAKKYEAARPEFAPEGIRDVDAVLTTTELIEMVELTRMDVDTVTPQEFDEPYKHVSGAGVLFGVSGGVSEATLRMAVEKVSGESQDTPLEFTALRGLEGIKTARVTVGDQTLRLAVISGLHNVEPLLQRLAKGDDIGLDIIEVMACPGGCIAGAGHPVPECAQELAQRKEVLVTLDAHSTLRRSQENPDIVRLYNEFFGEPNSALAKRLLHTHFTPRAFPQEPAASQRADSAYATQQIRVCVGEQCSAKGAYALLEAIKEKVHTLGMDHMISVKPQLCHGHSESETAFVALNGQKVDAEKLQDLEQFLKECLTPYEAALI